MSEYEVTGVEAVEGGWLLDLRGASFIDCPNLRCAVEPLPGERVVVTPGRLVSGVRIGARIYREARD